MLTDGFEAELVETAERGEVRANEGNAEHVDVFQMMSVSTLPSTEGPNLYPASDAPTPVAPPTPSITKSPTAR